MEENIGVNVKLVNQEWKTFLDTRTRVLLMWPVQAGVLTTTNQLLPEHHAFEQLDEYRAL